MLGIEKYRRIQFSESGVGSDNDDDDEATSNVNSFSTR